MTFLELFLCVLIAIMLDFSFYQSQRARHMTDVEYIRFYYFKLMDQG